MRACWLWVPDFHSSLSLSDTASGVRSGGIWFKPAGGYSAAAVKYIITGVIPLLAPRLRPPPSAMQDDFYRVVCSGLWPWKPWVLSDTHQPFCPAVCPPDNGECGRGHVQYEAVGRLFAWAVTENVKFTLVDWRTTCTFLPAYSITLWSYFNSRGQLL